MSGDAAVRRQLAGGDRFNGVEGFVAEHRTGSGFRVQGRETRRSLQLRLQHAPQLLLRTKQLRLDRAERQLHRLGEVLVLHAVQVVRRDEQPVVRRGAARWPSRAGRAARDRRSGDRATPAARRAAPSSSRATPRPRPPGPARRRWRRSGRSRSRAAPRRGNRAARDGSAGTRPARGPRRAIDPVPCAQSTRTRGPCSGRPAPETHPRRRDGSARRARARGQPPSVETIRARERSIVSPSG